MLKSVPEGAKSRTADAALLRGVYHSTFSLVHRPRLPNPMADLDYSAPSIVCKAVPEGAKSRTADAAPL